MIVAVLILIVSQTHTSLQEDSRSHPDHVDPWDVITEYDFSSSHVALKSQLPVVDKALRLAQKDIKYFQDVTKPWEAPDSGEDHPVGVNYTAWNKTYIRPPEGFGDKPTSELMKKLTEPEFDITKIKLKTDKNNNESCIFGVVMKSGAENKILGYSSKRLHVQINAPSYSGAADNELGRYLARVLCLSRKVIKIKQGAGQNIRKVRIPKSAVHEKVYLRKLIKEFDLVEVTEPSADAK